MSRTNYFTFSTHGRRTTCYIKILSFQKILSSHLKGILKKSYLAFLLSGNLTLLKIVTNQLLHVFNTWTSDNLLHQNLILSKILSSHLKGNLKKSYLAFLLSGNLTLLKIVTNQLLHVFNTRTSDNLLHQNLILSKNLIKPP